MTRSLIALTVLLVTTFSMTGLQVAYADHEPNHRYLLKGEVVDGDGNPWANQKVSVTHGSQKPVVAQTDGSGAYQAQLHIHDVNLGDEVTVVLEATNESHIFIVEFDPEDVTSQRIGTLDIVTDESAPEASASDAIPPYIWLVAVVLLLIGSYIGIRTYSKRKRAAEKARLKAARPEIGNKRKSKGKKSKGKKKRS